MRVGIISDLHDQLGNWQIIKGTLAKNNAKELIIAGDITSVEALDKIAFDFSGRIHVVFGNMDKNTELMELASHKFHHLKIYGFHGDFTISGKHFFVSHYEQEVKAQAQKNNYNILICGHTHEHKIEQNKDYILINPGTAGGMREDGYFAILDLKENKVNFIKI